MYDVTAMGELLIDFTPAGKNEQGAELFSRNPGGAPANVAAMVARLGAKAAFMGKVGNDSFGQFLKSTLEEAHVDVSGLITDGDYLTTLAFVQLDSKGDRSFSFYRKNGADIMFTEGDIKKGVIDNTKIFHFGSVSLTSEPCRSATLAAVRYAKEQGKIISYDPNYRPLLWDSPERAKAEILSAIPFADILKVSHEETEFLFGESDPAKAVEKLKGPSLILVSLGPDGAFYSTAQAQNTLPTYDVKTVDTTGAGDSFLGSVLYRLKDLKASEISQLSKEFLDDVLDFANAAGSLSTTAIGAIPSMPDLAAVENCRKK